MWRLAGTPCSQCLSSRALRHGPRSDRCHLFCDQIVASIALNGSEADVVRVDDGLHGFTVHRVSHFEYTSSQSYFMIGGHTLFGAACTSDRTSRYLEDDWKMSRAWRLHTNACTVQWRDAMRPPACIGGEDLDRDSSG
jgi:hypothetical protein